MKKRRLGEDFPIAGADPNWSFMLKFRATKLLFMEFIYFKV